MQVTLPEELVARLEAAAQAEGKSLEQWLGDKVEGHADERQWQDLLAYGRDRGRASGYNEEDSPRVVKEWRREQRDSSVRPAPGRFAWTPPTCNYRR